MIGNTDMHLLITNNIFLKVGVWIRKPVSIWCDHHFLHAARHICYICSCHTLCCSSCVSLTCHHSPVPSPSPSVCVCVIVWAETCVLESEQIATCCNLFHNQDLYKYSALPLSHCQIVISAHSALSDSGPCLQSHVSSSCYSVLDFPTLLLPWIPLWTCLPCLNPSRSSLSLRTWFPATRPAYPDLHSISPLCFNKYLGYFIPVSSSESALGFPCSTLRHILPRLFSLVGRPALGRVLVVPNFIHLRMMEATVFLGTFNAAEM